MERWFSYPSMVMELSRTPATDLDRFIQDHLQPDGPFRRRVRKAVHDICSFLKERCFQDDPHRVRVSKVVKGGSSGKGTALRGRSDADLVVFLSELRSFQEQLNRQGEFIREIRGQLKAFQREAGVDFEIHEPRRAKPRALSFAVWFPELDDKVEFDVLPAFDVLGQWAEGPEPHIHEDYRPDPQIYVKLIRECTRLGKEGEFAPCFTELQRAFLRQRPTKLKSLIRLVKHWYQLSKERLGKPLPPQYALELLTVYAWERGCKETCFSTAEGFRTVLELVVDYRQLCVYWTKYYDFENPVMGPYLRTRLEQPRPVILDPADPTGNVAGRGDWWRLAQEAAAWLSYPCLKNWDGSPVRCWDIGFLKESKDCSIWIDVYPTDEDEQYSEYHPEDSCPCTIL